MLKPVMLSVKPELCIAPDTVLELAVVAKRFMMNLDVGNVHYYFGLIGVNKDLVWTLHSAFQVCVEDVQQQRPKHYCCMGTPIVCPISPFYCSRPNKRTSTSEITRLLGTAAFRNF
jgi:hypothetical protein